MRIALAISLVVHVCLLVAFIVWRVQWSRLPDGGDTTSVGSSSDGIGGDGTGTPGPVGPESPTVPADLLRSNVEKAIAKSESLDEQEQLDKLGEQIEKLDATVAEESIDELTGRFHEWTGTEQRASQPAGHPVEGTFDSHTAQFHDVTRIKGPDDRWQYRSILVDAEGRTLEVDLDPEDGRRVYETMQRLRGSPLAEKLYRQIAMPLLDKILKAQENLDKSDAGS